jgi:hypothetical protein
MLKYYAWISFILFILLWIFGILLIHIYINNLFLNFILDGLLFFFLLIIHGWISSKILYKKEASPPLRRPVGKMTLPLYDPDHEDYRLTLDESSEIISDHLAEKESCFKFIYLFGFDRQDRIIFGHSLAPNDPPVAFDLLLSYARDLMDFHDDNIYFIVKAKRFADFFEGLADMFGTKEQVKGFIAAGEKNFSQTPPINPALNRYLIEFINETLDLPYRFSEQQRLVDKKSLMK